MNSQRCKGAWDMLPRDTRCFRYIEDAFRSSCLNWGYQEVKTPTLEYLHLFTSAGTLTPSMLNKVYSFLDWDGWSGERVVLRPDGTIPVARLYIENMAPEELCRLFYVTNVFAFEESGKENREQWQCGVELLGDPKPASDVEIIMLAIEILKNSYLENIEVQLSHAGVLKALLKDMKLKPEQEKVLLTEIRDGNWKVLTKTKSGNSDTDRLLKLLLDLRGKSSGFLENIKAFPGGSANLKRELDNFTRITSLLDALECQYQIDITSTIGFEYYTGLCFQFSVNNQRVGGGGRYNDLIPLIGGLPVPACGFALYFTPLMKLVKPKLGQNVERGVLIRGMKQTPGITNSCFCLAQSLRSVGYVTELDFDDRQTDWRWLVTVGQKASLFTIIDRLQNRRIQASSIEDVVGAIGGSA
jgi:histidyl-tRNA synthetase